MTPLLDVNVLVALAWPPHVHHAAARAWFRQIAPTGWATSALTESGFIRVSSNVTVIPDARSPLEAATLLRALCQVGRHEYWGDEVRMVDALEGVHGYRQVTDAHLLQLAAQHAGAVATFDSGLIALAQRRSQEAQLIPLLV